MATVQAQQSLRRTRKGVCKMDQGMEIGLRLECLRLACGRNDMNPEMDVVTTAQQFYDFCTGNKSRVEPVPEDAKPPF